MSSPRPTQRTLVVGHVTHDRYPGGFKAGGCAYYGAEVHRRLKGQTRLLSVVGDDFECDAALADIEHTKVRRGQTTVFANYYPDDAPRVQLLEAIAPDVSPAICPSDWRNADLVHLAPVLGEVPLSDWLQALRDGGHRGRVAINIQGWIKVGGAPVDDPTALESLHARGVAPGARQVVQRPWEIEAEAFRGVDIACLSEEDLIDQGDLLERLLSVVPIVALTLGTRGSRIFQGGRTIEVGIFPTEAVDPTGAGDVFAATFTHHLMLGAEPVEAARQASAASSIVVEGLGPSTLHRLGEAPARASKIPARTLHPMPA
ncbi:sugar kinase [Lujinxingia sediminis]|uniref:Sugar kinase n=1 Tax=Lujinxingia sediminis TaxID=2480984 RepID=A0ABY0CPF7_9DELT|nr:PfkB family carbohydrate kinase [Lujinxingia sediminis]RVU41434.1 sugar kinase [Lujinxingia sediminis]